MTFESLALCEPLLRGLQAAGYKQATPVQAKAIPPALAGQDVLGRAQTGTGKTAAFALPILQRLMLSAVRPDARNPRSQQNGRRAILALILTPTRELAVQIGNSLRVYGKFTGIRHTVIFGGVGQGPQVRALQAGVDVLVATPGRLLDLIHQKFIQLASVEFLVLDEADHMLDMGFIDDMKRIVARVPAQRQTLMFSATMPPQMRELAAHWLRQPVEVKVAPVGSTPDRVAQWVCFVDRKRKPEALVHFLNAMKGSRTLVFSRTKHGADKIVRHLERDGIRAISIHGNKSQSRRLSALREFSAQRPPVLVATDLAARGLDFSAVSHVINFDLPDVAETYVHRIGRTARAGADGNALSFCDRDERKLLRMIEKLIGNTIPIVSSPAFSDEPDLTAAKSGRARNAPNGNRAMDNRAPSQVRERIDTGNHVSRRTGQSQNSRRRRPGDKSTQARGKARQGQRPRVHTIQQ